MNEFELRDKLKEDRKNIKSFDELISFLQNVKENCNYGTRNFRVSLKNNIPVECVEAGIVYRSFHEAAQKTNIEISSINMCCTGYRNRQTAGGFHWRYAS